MAEPFMGEIKMVGFNFPPKGWALCDGTLLNSQQHSSLYSLLGNAFGGDGQTTFALPDMRGRFPIGASMREEETKHHKRGAAGGAEEVSLDIDKIPAHSHALNASSDAANSRDPGGRVLAKESTGRTSIYSSAGVNTTMNSSAITNTGSGHSHENMPPFLAIYFIIALVGEFPPRN